MVNALLNSFAIEFIQLEQQLIVVGFFEVFYK